MDVPLQSARPTRLVSAALVVGGLALAGGVAGWELRAKEANAHRVFAEWEREREAVLADAAAFERTGVPDPRAAAAINARVGELQKTADLWRVVWESYGLTHSPPPSTVGESPRPDQGN